MYPLGRGTGYVWYGTYCRSIELDASRFVSPGYFYRSALVVHTEQSRNADTKGMLSNKNQRTSTTPKKKIRQLPIATTAPIMPPPIAIW